MFVFLLFLYYFFLSDVSDVLKKAPSKKEVLKLLNDIRDRWNIIGIALEVQSATLGTLNQSRKSDDLKLVDVIGAWFENQNPPVTWKTLIDAIEGPLVRHKKKANEIRDYLGIPH